MTFRPDRPGRDDAARPASRARRRSVGAARAAEQLAGQVGQQDRERDLERQVGPARLEGEDRGRQAVPGARVQQRRALRARDDRSRPVGQGQLAGLGDVGRREVDVAQDRLVGIERADARVRRACRSRRRAGSSRGGAIARIGAFGSVAGTKPSKMTRSHGRPSVRSVAGPYSLGVTPYSSTFGQVATARSRGTDRPSPTTRTSRVRSGGMTAQARSSAASWSGAVVDGRIAADEADLDRLDAAGDVVDDHVGPGLRLELDVADLEQTAVAPQLQAPRRAARGRGWRRSRTPSA